MKVLVIFMKWFGYIWITLACIIIFFGYYGVWMQKGFGGIQELLSPFNIINHLVTLITLAPGIGALILSGKLKAKLPTV